MSRIDFYHLQKDTLEQALPKLVLKAYETGKKIKITIGTDLRVDFINTLLWTFDEESFIAHGTKKDGMADMQPVYISADDDVPNGASFLFLADGAYLEPEKMQNFERVFYLFDGHNENELSKAREVWKACGQEEIERHYWQQDAFCKWAEKI